MKLEDIGFYTLSDDRAQNVSNSSPLKRCELLLTDRCNFKCKYCRGLKKPYRGDLSFTEATQVVKMWCDNGLENIRFSGGEPTIWESLLELVSFTRSHNCIKHIAISTNGSASINMYHNLIQAGVNDFSVSFDACCSSSADKMAGVDAKFEHLCQVIGYLSRNTYCTVGIVLDERNRTEANKTIELADSLGVSDIRVIPSAQYNQDVNLPEDTGKKILSYRARRANSGLPVRGIRKNDTTHCHLVKDDMVIANGYHFPCVIYMREGGDPIGSIPLEHNIKHVRQERLKWFETHNSHRDPICARNCLDVCIAHNNKVDFYQKKVLDFCHFCGIM